MRAAIVEEAAEVMEAHTVASLTAYCQQLILIGWYWYYLFNLYIGSHMLVVLLTGDRFRR